MKILKQITAYLIWIIIALLIGIGYMRIILGAGPKEETYGYFTFLVELLYNYGLIHVGLIIGSIIALLFILLDIFYLKKKLKNNIKSTSIRFLFLIGVTIIVGIIHYILEEVIDVI